MCIPKSAAEAVASFLVLGRVPLLAFALLLLLRPFRGIVQRLPILL